MTAPDTIEQLEAFAASWPEIAFFGSNGIWCSELVGIERLAVEGSLDIDEGWMMEKLEGD